MKKDGVFPIKKTYTAYRTDLTITPKLPGLSMKKSLDKKKEKKGSNCKRGFEDKRSIGTRTVKLERKIRVWEGTKSRCG